VPFLVALAIALYAVAATTSAALVVAAEVPRLARAAGITAGWP
jgi:hypothetical protein